MPSINAMGGNRFKNYKEVCQMHTHGQFVKVVVKTMFLVVKLCILNQIRRYWLLFWCFKCHPFNYYVYEFNNMTKLKGDFDSKLGALRVCMMAKIQVVLAMFLAFASTYNASKADNMLALMLDPCFKSFDVVKAFVGWEKIYRWW